MLPVRAFVSSVALSAGGKGVMFVLTLLLANLLGAQGLGQVMLAITVATFVLYPIMEAGTELVLLHDAVRGEPASAQAAVRWKVLAGLVLTPVLLAGAWWIYGLSWVLTLGGCVLIATRSLQNGPVQVLRAQHRAVREHQLNLAQRLLALAALGMLAVGLPHLLTPVAGVWLQAVPGVLFVGAFLASVPRTYRGPAPVTAAPMLPLLRRTAPMFLSTLSWMVYYRADQLFIGYFLTEADVGEYGAAYQFLDAAGLVPLVLMSYIVPGVAARIEREGFRTWRELLGPVGLCVAGGLLVGAALMAASPLLPWLLPAFLNVPGYVRGLAVAMPAIFLGYFGTQVLVILERRYTLLGITTAMALANVVLNALWIPRLGVPGAIAATVLCEFGIGVATVAVVLWQRRNAAPVSKTH